MRAKKITAVLFALVFALSLALFVTGCGEPAEYTVTYVYNNGEADFVTTVPAGGTVTEPKDPVREGFDFSGWFASEDAEQPYDFSAPVHENLTLTARWTESGEEPEPPAARVLLSWQTSEFAEYVTEDGTLPRYVDEGTEVSFSLRVLSHAVGTPVVTAGGTVLTPVDGVYTFTAAAPSMTVSISGLEADTTPMRGAGTEEDPFLLETVSHLNRFIRGVNDPDDTLFDSAWIRLEADLDLNGETVETIGSELNVNHFSGVFDGNGHTISDFRVESDTSVIGFFGYLVQGRVEDLHLSGMTIEPDMSEAANYIVGGVVAYNMGGDVFGCSAEGQITLRHSQADLLVYVGGICGFVQGYGEDYSGTVSFCTSDVNIRSSGSQPVLAAGGVVGSAVGTAASAPANVYNCVYSGSISGRSMLSGGVVGYLRTFASVANSFSAGSVYAQSPETVAAAGGLVGMAETETAITWSYSSATLHVNGQEPGSGLIEGTAVGLRYADGTAGVDSRQALLLGAYQTNSAGQLVQDGQAYDMTDPDTVFALLGWREAEWQFESGRPSVLISGAETNAFTVTFDFSGESVTAEGNDGGMLSQTRDEVRVSGGSLPVYWIYGGDGRNTFISDDGLISYGYFLDEACTQRIPSAMMLTRDMTVYVGFADYAEAEGEYFAYLSGREVRLVLDGNGRLTQYFEGSVVHRMYVYDGEKIFIENGRFASLADGEIEDGDYYARIEDGRLIIYDGVNFSESAGTALTAYPDTAARGEWYSPAGETYLFRGDGSGTLTSASGAQTSFTYECVGLEVTLNLGDRRIEALISEDGQSMASADGLTLSVERFDLFAGDWESPFNHSFTVSFDGKGSLTAGGDTLAYAVTGETLTFEGGRAFFNEDGLLVFERNGVQTVMGRAGSLTGTWTDEVVGYSIVLEGIGREGYGLAYDTNGFNLTYSAEPETASDGSVSYYLTFWYGTTMYGYGRLNSISADYGRGTLFEAAFYTASSGMIVDDYNMTYADPLAGSWNGSDGSALSFNGEGEYDFSFQLSDGTLWAARGEVTFRSGQTSFTVPYDYDRLTGTASFTNGGTSYRVTLTAEGLTLSDGQAEISYRLPDELSGRTFRSGERLLSFDGRSNVGLGTATLTGDGTETFDYALEDGVITLSRAGSPVWTAQENEDGLLAMTPAAGGETLLFGLYSAMVGPEWLGPNGITFRIGSDFTLDGQAAGTFGGAEASFVYADASTVQLYLEGSFAYFLVIQDEQNVGVFDASLSLVNVFTLPDGWAGRYTAADGSALTLDGRSNASDYVYASAELSVTVTEGGVAYPERYSYVYEIRDGVIIISELDRSGEQPRLIEKYRAYSQETAGGVAYTSESGLTLWLVAEEA